MVKINDICIKKVVDCHLKVFPHSLYNNLGRNFLDKTFSWYLKDPIYRKLIIYEENSDVLGFATMRKNNDNESYTKFIISGFLIGLIKNFFRVTTWMILIKLLNKFKKKRTTKVKGMELISLGVDPEHQRKGIGMKLLIEFESIAKDLNCSNLMLWVRNKNENAIKFYLKNGWTNKNVEDLNYILFIKEI